MPIVELHVLQGYGPDEKRRLGESLTDAVRLVVSAAPDAITVIIHEMTTEHYYRGRTPRSGAPALPDPELCVRDFLGHMERRDLAAARALLGDGFTMQFPGSPEMAELEDLIAWSKPRYQRVAKTYERFDAMQSEGDAALVYCFGTLSGEWNDGTAFTDIRFIDRFEIVGGKITRQDVWNDMAEVKPKA